MRFYIGCKIANWVITIDSKKQLLLSNPDNKEFLTECKSISGRGIKILLMLILSSVLILEKWIQENNLNRDILLVTSPSDYPNAKFAFK